MATLATADTRRTRTTAVTATYAALRGPSITATCDDVAANRQRADVGWARIDDSLHDHPKMLGLSLEALGLWVKCLAWAHRHHDSDDPGFLPLDIVKSLGGRRYLRLSSELTQRKLWDISELSPGWWIHNYVDYLPASEKPGKAADVSKSRSEAGKKGAAKRWNKQQDTDARSTPDGKLPSGLDSPDPTRPDQTRVATTATYSGDTYERETQLSRSYPSNVVLIANKYTGPVGLTNRSRVCDVVELALKHGYLSTKVEDALSRLAANGMPCTPDTLRIEIEGRPNFANGRASPSRHDENAAVVERMRQMEYEQNPFRQIEAR